MPWPSWLSWGTSAGDSAASRGIMPGPSGVAAEIATSECANLDRLNANLLYEYVRSIYLWRCVDLIASMAASVPFLVRNDESQLTADQRGVEALLKRPNPQWTGPALQYHVAASLAVANKAFILRVRGGGNSTLELWPINPSDVTIVFANGSRMIAGFDVMTGGRTQRYPVDDSGDSDLIYIRRPALNRETDKSPASVAAAPAEVFTRVLQRCCDIVSNSSNITGLLSTESEIAKNAIQDIKDRLVSYKTGASQSGAVLVTSNAKWNLTRLSEDPASALSVEIKDSLARDVAATFGVPTQLLGLPGSDTFNNLSEARVGLYTNCVLSYIDLYVAGLNHALMGANGAAIEPDTEHIPAMIAFRRELMKTAVAATMLSVNEQRAMVGYPPFDDGQDDADVPVILETLRLKRLAIEVQGGAVGNILEPSSRGDATGAGAGGKET